MRSAILLFAAKRANRAMLTSTMRWAFETTMDHNGAPPEPRQPMPLAGVVPLDAMRFGFARVQRSDRQEHVIDRIVIRTGEPSAPARQPRDEALTAGRVTTAACPVHPLPEARSHAFQIQRGRDFVSSRAP